MAIKPQALQRATVRNVGDHIDRAWLENKLVIVSVNEYEPEAVTSFGKTSQVDCDLLIASGEHQGERDEHFVTWGNLARQIGANEVGSTVVVRVIQGGPPDKRWWGVDADVTDDEFAHAQQVLLDVAGVKRPTASNGNGGKAAARKIAATTAYSTEPPF